MKTTIEIADELIKRARDIQVRDDVTLRSLVEDGLREVITQRSRRSRRPFVPVFAGPRSVDPSMTPARLNRLIRESNDRPGTLREFGDHADSPPGRASTRHKHDRG